MTAGDTISKRPTGTGAIMAGGQLDTLTRSLTGGASSRRRLVMGVAGSALAAVATALGFAEAGATHYGCLHVGKPC